MFLTSPLRDYYEKGEIKKRYYNPESFFSEVHFLTFADNDISPELVKTVVGDADIYIHPMGFLGVSNLLSMKSRVIEKVSEIAPNCIRAYDPYGVGFLAVRAGQALDIPTVISVHFDFNLSRQLYIYRHRRIPYLLKQLVFQLFLLKRVLNGATKIICVYKLIEKEVRRWVKDQSKVELIYNRVYTEDFRPWWEAQATLEEKQPSKDWWPDGCEYFATERGWCRFIGGEIQNGYAAICHCQSCLNHPRNLEAVASI